jgi:hypothetical protein
MIELALLPVRRVTYEEEITIHEVSCKIIAVYFPDGVAVGVAFKTREEKGGLVWEAVQVYLEALDMSGGSSKFSAKIEDLKKVDPDLLVVV